VFVNIYKRYIKKIIKAPYHLYVKEGEQFFRSCKLGETLTNLTPGRYYFPNPFKVATKKSLLLQDLPLELIDTTEPELKDIFNIKLCNFVSGDNNNSSTQKYSLATTFLGNPSLKDNAMSMEYGGTFAWNGKKFDDFNPNDGASALKALEDFLGIPI
jgi:hypothetical protein